MTTSDTFAKPYRTSEDVHQAAAHHAWLTEHAHPLRQPPITAVHDDRIDFAFIHGRHTLIADLLTVATVLGRAHAAAWASDLHRARLTTPHPLPSGHVLADFVTPRVAALRRRHQAGLATTEQLAALEPLLEPVPGTPVAFYKDTNPRNVLITAAGEPVAVDVDDLTLAPFGYDLAKLLVTLSMTHGPIPVGYFTAALDFYNESLSEMSLEPVSLTQFLGHADLHHLLTLPYLGTGGYRHPWPTVRPALEDSQ
ncbi:phosphotransferase [Nonomuraea sediminis]|uniref:phosphotransferase n=1 Tax=Nonomuraea sediminis TaxID=2835864 RepID=UPI001BDBF1A8|nr:phosphotransferase [Nonomuraea sediminis]